MNGFEDDEHFFASYEAEQTSSAQSQPALEFDEPEVPTEAQLAHWARFRRPVASFVGAMALLSVVALVKRDSDRESVPQRELVAHLGAAVAAPTPAASAAQTGAAPAALVPSDLALVGRGMCPASEAAPPRRALFAKPYSTPVGVCSASPAPSLPLAGGARVPASQLAVR